MNNHLISHSSVGHDWAEHGPGTCRLLTGLRAGLLCAAVLLASPSAFALGIATDAVGNFYIADSTTHVIRKIDASGRSSVLAGASGRSGSNDGLGREARFIAPRTMTVDASGNLYVVDGQLSATNVEWDEHEGVIWLGNRLRKITPAGDVTTLAGRSGVLSSGAGADTDGQGAKASFGRITALTTDVHGNVYLTDDNKGYPLVRKVDVSGRVTTVVSGRSMTAPFNANEDLLFWQLHEERALYASDAGRLWMPHGIALDAQGNIFVADTRRLVMRSAPSEEDRRDRLQWRQRFADMQGIPADSIPINLDMPVRSVVWRSTLRKMSRSGAISVIAGRADEHALGLGSEDGWGRSARFGKSPYLSRDASGTLYVADTVSGTIRKISTDGLVTTLAGRAGERGSVDGPGSEARFHFPQDISVDSQGNVYVIDAASDRDDHNTGSKSVRKISPAGVVSTILHTGVSEG